MSKAPVNIIINSRTKMGSRKRQRRNSMTEFRISWIRINYYTLIIKVQVDTSLIVYKVVAN